MNNIKFWTRQRPKSKALHVSTGRPAESNQSRIKSELQGASDQKILEKGAL